MIQFIMFNVSSSIYFLKVDQCGIFTHLETEIFEVCLRTFSPTRTSLSSSPMINVTKSNQKFNHVHYLLIIWTKEMNKVRLAYYFWACSSSSLQNPRFSKLMNCLVIWTQCTIDLLLLSGIRIQSWQSRGDTKALGQSIYSSCICYTSVIIFSNIFFVHELYVALSTNMKLL